MQLVQSLRLLLAFVSTACLHWLHRTVSRLALICTAQLARTSPKATTFVDTAPTINYPVLDAEQRQIRLLSFKFNERREILGHFTVVSLDQRPQYTALSYVWGSEPPNRLIWIDSQPFGVRPGLFAYMQLAAAENTVGEGIFIDAICINQADVAEKSSQIALMGSLYELASEVTVWFGDEDGWTLRLAEKYPAIQDPTILRSCLIHEATVHLTAQEVLDLRIEVYGGLILHEYWSRVWTAQEFLLPKLVVLRAGRLKFDDVTLFELLESAPTRDEPFSLQNVRLQSARMVTSGYASSARPRSSQQRGHSQDLTRYMAFANGRIVYASAAQPEKRLLNRAIILFSEQRCSISRDRIFGLLGLCRSGIVPDHNAPIIKIYIEALFEGLREIRSLHEFPNMIASMGRFIAGLLSALGLRLESPAVFLITTFALDRKIAEGPRTIALVFEINLDLSHPQLNDLLHNRDLLQLVCGLQMKNAMMTFASQQEKNSQVTGPEGESGTVLEWMFYIDQVNLWECIICGESICIPGLAANFQVARPNSEPKKRSE
ncbi:hypothetical protein LTR97_012700 [Elasticomyces elasticus]|uniref:Heterokaryon incompatibility domain-containing protein n=1 Tax=Elasticomyces elasticus TaxID=574655 RepID=A0AAN7VXZ7_9PEZI|nr:hypothetical protein LTR97_012700 [Elasticomyces elasticus]